MLKEHLEKQLDLIKNSGLYRKRSMVNDSLLNFSCNDYLSLTTNKIIKQAFQKGFEILPSGSGGSIVISGFHKIHQDLENEFSSALNVEAALLFSSGYAANLSLGNFLNSLNAKILIDKSIHASIYDGLHLSGARYVRYLHNNLNSLMQNISKYSKDDNKIILTESIFSMSGQVSGLQTIVNQTKNYNCVTIVDEAHAFGVRGKEGLGLVYEHGLTLDEVPLRVIPFGKAMSGAGAIIAGDKLWIDMLLQYARSFIYSTAPSPAYTYGLLKTLEIIRKADDRRNYLNNLIKYFRNLADKSNLVWSKSYTQIQQLQLGCPFKAQIYTEKLLDKGIFCLPLRQPTVNKQETGLRIVLNYNHQAEHIDYLFQCLEEI